MKILVDYPSAQQEQDIIRYNIENVEPPVINPVMSVADILAIRRAIFDMVKVSDEIIEKVQSLVTMTRPGYTDIPEIDEYIDSQDGGGASPRAGIHILRTARSHAAINGRDFVSPQDIATVLLPVLRHRLILRPDLAMNSLKEREKLLNDILELIFQRVWS
jgi:MoxR-like ATPase